MIKLTLINCKVEKKMSKDKIAAKSRKKDFAIVANQIFNLGGIK